MNRMQRREQNRQNMIAYFKEGCKQERTLRFGVEVEHFVTKNNKESVSYYGQGGMEEILEKLSCKYFGRQESEGHLIGLYRDDAAISLEPAAQLEISISPQSNVNRIMELYEKFETETKNVLQMYQYQLMTAGYQPASTVSELLLIPKERYAFMDQYFDKIGCFGKQMMRGTASTQVSIDFFNESDFTDKYYIAFHLIPFLNKLCENTLVYEGKPTQEHNIRLNIWKHTDEKRVCVTPFLNQKQEMNFSSYSDFVMQSPIIVNQIGEQEEYSEKTIGEICEERILNREELEHVLSMVFPLIRLKHYLEIRIADSMPKQSVKGYILLLKGIFLEPKQFRQYIENLQEEQKSIFEDLPSFFRLIEQNLTAEEWDDMKPYISKITTEGTLL